jgi:hypothetical protein
MRDAEDDPTSDESLNVAELRSGLMSHPRRRANRQMGNPHAADEGRPHSGKSVRADSLVEPPARLESTFDQVIVATDTVHLSSTELALLLGSNGCDRVVYISSRHARQ